MNAPTQVVSRLSALRQAMRASAVDAYVAVTADPHLSEYLPEHWQGRQWLSGFSGSAGTLVVTLDSAALWTDSRYWEQAEKELADTGIQLMKAGASGVSSPPSWVAGQLKKGSRVNIDGQVLAVQAYRQWHEALDAAGMVLDCNSDVLAGLWQDRPALPQGQVYRHLPPFACRSVLDNLAQVRQAMTEHKAQWLWLSSLDDIAWLFNLRGNDVSYNPVFLAHALVGLTSARLFVAGGKIPEALVHALVAEGVQVSDYDQASRALADLPSEDTLMYDPARATVGVLQAAGSVQTVQAINPSQLLKSRKNAAEVAHIRATMEADGAALCEFFAWFESALGSERITELTIDEKITQARARQPHFVCPSFGTIAAFGPNAAMPHYHATASSHAVIDGNGLLLIDSGGQYLGGTTDITRVVPVGQVSDAQKVDYTAVLKGMIALSRAVFPQGLAAPLLDVVARMPIWQMGAEYGHGTGHGVGYFMNVHEGPQSIAYRATLTPTMAMQAGMVTSNEPGLYRAGRWGIRIENLVLTVPARSTEFGDFLAFETLTLCPIDTRCIAMESLAAEEVQWLDAYHAHVRERLLPRVSGQAKAWLLARTEAISKL